MPRKTRRDVIAALGASVTVGLAGCASGGDGTETDDEMDATATDESMDGGSMDGTDTDTGGAMGTANVRVAHFSPDAPNVDVYVDGDQVLSDVPFGATSDYLEVPAGDRTVEITAAGDPETVPFEGEVPVAADTDYTVAAVGEISGESEEFRPLVLEDDNSDVGGDTARLRLVHASPDAPAVDVTTAGGDTLFDGVPFGESGYVEVPAGTYTVQVRPDTESNDGDVVAEFTVELAGGTVYTGFAGGYLAPEEAPADVPFDLTLTVDAGAGGGGLVGSGNLRVSHMSPDAPNVDVYVDGDQVLSDVPFGATSDYMSVPAGERTVRITAAGDPDTVPFEGPVTVATDTDYTVAAIGELTSDDSEFRPLVLEDDNSDPGGNDARLRVVHASPDAPAVDVTAAGGDAVLFDGVPFGGSGYTTAEANDYTVQIRGDTESNDGDVVADYDVSLNGGTVYTAFAQGYLSPDDEPVDESFDLQVVQDASY